MGGGGGVWGGGWVVGVGVVWGVGVGVGGGRGVGVGWGGWGGFVGGGGGVGAGGGCGVWGWGGGSGGVWGSDLPHDDAMKRAHPLNPSPLCGSQRSVDEEPDHVARRPHHTTGPPATTAYPQHYIRHIDHVDPGLGPPTNQATYHVTDRSRAHGDPSAYERQPPAGPVAAHRHVKHETHGHQTHTHGLTMDRDEQRPTARHWDGRDPLGPSDRDFDRIARHITRFDPRPGMPTNTRSYLRVVDFHADRIPHASQDDKIYLIRLTSNGEVNDFIERQPRAIKHDYNELCKAILAEYSDYGASGNLTAAMAVKQAHNEFAECYYHRLRQAFFGNRNYEGMEEDTNFRALYLQNLHPNLSQLLGVYACPLTQDIRQLKTLVARAQGKHLLKTQAKPQTQPSVYSVDNHMELEGAPTTPKHKWEPNHRPQRNNQRQAETKSVQPRDQKLPQYGERRAGQADGKDRTPQRSRQDRTATAIDKSNLSREEQSLLRTLLRKAKERRTDNADVFAVSVPDEAEDAPYRVNNDLSEQELDDDYSDPHILEELQNELGEETWEPHPHDEDAYCDQRDVMVVQVSSITDPRGDGPSTIRCEPPFHQFIGDLQQKGANRKLYLSVTLEDQWEHEALIDTAADISLIAGDLFGKLQSLARKSHRDLKTQLCNLEIRPYSQVNTTIHKMALIQLTVGPMTLVHPVYISPFNSIPLLLGQDLLNHFEPLIDFQRLKIWAQVRKPLPIPRTLSETHCYLVETPPTAERRPTKALAETGRQDFPTSTGANFLCAFTPSAHSDSPGINAGVILEGANFPVAALAYWADKSAVSQDVFHTLAQNSPKLPFVRKASRFPKDHRSTDVLPAIGFCSLALQIHDKTLKHTFSVVKGLPHPIVIGGDVLTRLDTQIDTINNVLWSLTTVTNKSETPPLDNLKSGQTIPEVCQVAAQNHLSLPPNTSAPLGLVVLPGQMTSNSQVFFQPSHLFLTLGLQTEATPLLRLERRRAHVKVLNTTGDAILIPRGTPLGWLIDTTFHDFDLRLPVIGDWPTGLDRDPDARALLPKPSRSISLFTVPGPKSSDVYRVDLTNQSEMVLQTISVIDSGVDTFPTQVAHEPTQEPTACPSFEEELDKTVALADAINTDEERAKLRQVLMKYKSSFATDATDCGLTNIHTVRIPSKPNAPPTYVRQYKIPLASCTYSAPIWPVLKPNGKWRLTVDYRRLNSQIPLSRWPMTQLGQDLPKVRDAKFFSTLDIASGFWTIPVHPQDQHKLAFSFANKQYTFTRCPFGLSNSPAEFNIFLNKACPDAASRGTLIYVDDVLLRTTSIEEHLVEIDHVLDQLTSAGAKVSLRKCQWCRTKFVEHYAEIAKPLTNLLKKDTPFVWEDSHDEAMKALLDRLRKAPCLVYPNPNKPFFLEIGFSEHSLSAGLYQTHDSDKRIIAYASKTMAAPETKYSDCEKSLLATVWAVRHFSNYIGNQTVVVNTNHQPVTFLASQRLRDGIVTNARVATWLMALQSFDLQVSYAQKHRSYLGMGLAECQDCIVDTPAGTKLDLLPTPLEPQQHCYFDQNLCDGLPTAYVDGCSFHHETIKRAGVGIVWKGDEPAAPQKFLLGPQTSQYAEIAAILILLQHAVSYGINTMVICTDSNYARLSFSCHLPLWKKNDYVTSSKKPVKHKQLFMSCDKIVTERNMQIYWKKVRGHSREPGMDKELNDMADSLAKQGAVDGAEWHFQEQLPETPAQERPAPAVCAVTRANAPTKQPTPDVTPAHTTPAFDRSDLVSLQNADPTLKRLIDATNDPNGHDITPDMLSNRLGGPLNEVYPRQQIHPHGHLRIHQMGRRLTSPKRHSANDGLPTDEPCVLTIRTTVPS
uniref:ribonuclease H n=1 Tax=Knipowitschia caucasica TaxID=637954 RepID=A0AAV2MP73_KNICA